jgi:hypothetical protein
MRENSRANKKEHGTNKGNIGWMRRNIEQTRRTKRRTRGNMEVNEGKHRG